MARGSSCQACCLRIRSGPFGRFSLTALVFALLQKDAPDEVADEDLPEATVKEIDFEYARRPPCECSNLLLLSCSEEMKESKEAKEDSVAAVAILLTDAVLKSHIEVRCRFGGFCKPAYVWFVADHCGADEEVRGRARHPPQRGSREGVPHHCEIQRGSCAVCSLCSWRFTWLGLARMQMALAIDNEIATIHKVIRDIYATKFAGDTNAPLVQPLNLFLARLQNWSPWCKAPWTTRKWSRRSATKR